MSLLEQMAYIDIILKERENKSGVSPQSPVQEKEQNQQIQNTK